MQLAVHGGASAFSQHTAAAPTALDSKKQRPCRPACDTGRCVQLAMRCSIANTTSSWARDRKVPHDVRIGSSEIEPSGLTTVLRAICGLAICGGEGRWAALADAGASSGPSWAALPSALASADLPCTPSQQPQYAHCNSSTTLMMWSHSSFVKKWWNSCTRGFQLRQAQEGRAGNGQLA